VATPSPGGRGMVALGSSMGVSTTADSTTGLSTINTRLRTLGPRNWTLFPAPRITVTRAFLLREIQVSPSLRVAYWLRA